MRLTLGDRPVEVEVAVVRWSRDGKFGLEFISVKPEFQSQLRQFMKTPKWLLNLKKAMVG